MFILVQVVGSLSSGRSSFIWSLHCIRFILLLDVHVDSSEHKNIYIYIYIYIYTHTHTQTHTYKPVEAPLLLVYRVTQKNGNF